MQLTLESRSVHGRASALLAVLLFLTRPGSAQESSPDLEALKPAMAKMRDGTWDAADAEQVIKGLLDAGWTEPAGWWLEAADKALADKKLPPQAKAMLQRHRAAWQRQAQAPGPSKDLAGKIAGHARTVVALRNYAEGEKCLLVATKHLAVFPDPVAQRALDQAKAELARTKAKTDLNPKMLEAHQAMTSEMEGLSKEATDAFLEASLLHYEQAGCREGREKLRKLALGYHGDPAPPGAMDYLRRLNQAGRRVEPVSKLQLWLCADEPYRAFLDGEKLEPAETLKIGTERTLWVLSLPVLSGDLLVLSPEKETEVTAPIDRDFPELDLEGTFALEARLAAQALPNDAFHNCSLKTKEHSNPPSAKAVFGTKRKVKPEEWRTVRSRRHSDSKPPEHVLDYPTGLGTMSYGFYEDDQAVEAEFQKRELEPRWMTGRARYPVVLVRIPM